MRLARIGMPLAVVTLAATGIAMAQQNPPVSSKGGELRTVIFPEPTGQQRTAIVEDLTTGVKAVPLPKVASGTRMTLQEIPAGQPRRVGPQLTGASRDTRPANER